MVSDVNNSSLQLVEMCSSEGVWSPVCDNNWTLKDATVVCSQLNQSKVLLCRYIGPSYITVYFLYQLYTDDAEHFIFKK